MIAARCAQLLFEQLVDTEPLRRDQNFEPQRLRALVERAVAHLERARVGDALAHDVHLELRPARALRDRRRPGPDTYRLVLPCRAAAGR